MKTLVTSAALLDNRLETGGFALDLQDGRISEVRRTGAEGPYRNCIALPGLVQTHLHLCQTLFRGMAEGLSLIPWLEDRIWPLEASHTADTLAVSVLISLRELLASGCTGLLDMGSVENSDVTVDILRRSGIRAVACNTLMDKGPDNLRKDLAWLREETERTRKRCGGLVSHGLAPRFALSCSDLLWSWVSQEKGTRTTHASESLSELALPAIEAEGGYIRFLHSRGFLGRRTVLAHCIHLEPGEVDMLAETSTSVAHCPWTNLRLGSGIADVPLLSSSGVRVSLGSDGAACNNRLVLADDIRLAMSLAALTGMPGRLEGSFWLESATSGAAASLGWEGCGILSSGNSADIVLLEPAQQEWEELENTADPVAYILELDWSSRVRLTMVDGEVLYDDGEYPTLPPLPLPLAEARASVVSKKDRMT